MLLQLLPLQALPGGGVEPLQLLPLHAPGGGVVSARAALAAPADAVEDAVAVAPVRAATSTAALKIDVQT